MHLTWWPLVTVYSDTTNQADRKHVLNITDIISAMNCNCRLPLRSGSNQTYRTSEEDTVEWCQERYAKIWSVLRGFKVRETMQKENKCVSKIQYPPYGRGRLWGLLPPLGATAPWLTFLQSWADVKLKLTCNAVTYHFWDIHGLAKILDLGTTGNNAPKDRGEDPSRTHIYHHAKFHADQCQHR